MATNDLPRPIRWLQDYGRRYPEAWQTLEVFRNLRGTKPELDWPAWVYVPLAGAYSIVSRGDFLNPLDPRLMDVARVAGLGAWRMTKGIYRFDPVMFDELWHSGYDGPITLEPLKHLPEWSLYVETPDATIWDGMPLHGFFAFLEHDLNTGDDELYFLWDIDDPDGDPFLVSTVVHLNQPTLEEALRVGRAQGIANVDALAPEARMLVESVHGAPLEALADKSVALNKEAVRRALSLLFFLVASNDLRPGRPGQPDRPHRPQPTRTRKGPKLIPAPGPRIWEAGFRFGRVLRGAYAAAQPQARGKGTPKRPHVRRAHWHGYWTGPRSKPEERRLELRWLPPILVGAKEEDELPAVIWKIRA